jgi:hypothetical protein
MENAASSTKGFLLVSLSSPYPEQCFRLAAGLIPWGEGTLMALRFVEVLGLSQWLSYLCSQAHMCIV